MRSMKIDKLDSWLPVTHWVRKRVRKRRKNKIKRILSWLFQ